jgi:acetyltransferase-like isoleucine patch superfamily enzyme
VPTIAGLLKRLAFAVAFATVLPMVLLVWAEAMVGSEVGFGIFAQTLALAPGRIGVALRAAFYRGVLRQCSWETHIGFGSFFTHRDAVVAAGFSTGAFCVLGHVVVGRNVMLASRVSVPSGRRQHVGDAGEIVREPRFERVAIGEGSWIGEGAIVLADTGSNAVVSAGSVVVKPVPARTVVAGSPARILRTMAEMRDEARSA